MQGSGTGVQAQRARELHHVLLGHTKLFKRVTLADNIVFDAVINAWAGNVTDFLEELIEPLTGPIVQSASPPRSATVDDNDRLWRYLSDAGYEIASLETDISLIPKATVTLQLVRELNGLVEVDEVTRTFD